MGPVLIANRGEIAVRILATLAERGLEGIAVYAADEREPVHARLAPRAVPLPGTGVAAYLDGPAVIEAARSTGARALHPGYGFLSERADFARAVVQAGLTFVGPAPDTLALFGDKTRARALAQAAGVPVLPGTGPTDAAGARAFLESLGSEGAILLKAVAGGGGRGLRRVADPRQVEEAFARASSEAEAAFGQGTLYAEAWLPVARHVEVQLAGDGVEVVSLGDRDCSLQRRHQKLVEIAPAPGLDPQVRAGLHGAAVAIGRAAHLKNLATVEFLVAPDGRFMFLEANPRLQVEHTVTEAVLGLDLVGLQLDLAQGARLADLGLATPPAPQGAAIQCRILFERLGIHGMVRPAQGRIEGLLWPAGPGIRVDHALATGLAVGPAFDPLAAKLIAHHPGGFAQARVRLQRALASTVIDGVDSNLPLLRNLLARPEVAEGRLSTGLLDRLLPELGAEASDPSDDADAQEVTSPLAGRLVTLAQPGEVVAAGRPLAVVEAMKMEHELPAPRALKVTARFAHPGDMVAEGGRLLAVEPAEAGDGHAEPEAEPPRPELAELWARRAAGRDENRPQAVAKRRARGLRTARENIAHLCDPGSFTEVGDLVLAAQRRRRTLEDLIANTTSDGLVCGFGRVNGDLFGPERSRIVALSYDYTVLAGTQGYMNHLKKDRMFELAAAHRLPVVLFAEGGGGRPGDTDAPGVAGLDCRAFQLFARLSGKVPLVGIAAGYCFAGNAVLLGCCDVVIATRSAHIGVGGPAMIEGGGLGRFPPEAIGPYAVQEENGVIDVGVADEAEAVAVARRWLAFFQGDLPDGPAPDGPDLRRVVPSNRRRLYAMRDVLAGIVDADSLLELRPRFGRGLITALARIGGRAVGLIANDPTHLSGAIDAAGADKAARFLQLCDAHGLPVVSLVDCPGLMVGPEAERTAMVRHAGRLMVAGANLRSPLIAVVIRKGYGLGAQAMVGGSFRAPFAIAAWPTGEFGGMNLEGAVRLGYRRELEAIADPAERDAAFRRMVEEAHARGRAVNMAAHFEIDTVIDPAETRAWIQAMLAVAGPRRPAPGRPFVDTW